jgi:hypothetical protein
MVLPAATADAATEGLAWTIHLVHSGRSWLDRLLAPPLQVNDGAHEKSNDDADDRHDRQIC